MNKFFAVSSMLGIILSGCSFNVEAKGRGGRSGHRHHVSGHSRHITTTKNGVTHTRNVQVKGHYSK